MSTELLREISQPDGGLELTTLGKHVEILRIERGVSKQGLARHAGTSRQQLWRVMTGKSELTASLRQRLGAALSVEAEELASGSGSHSMRAGQRSSALELSVSPPVPLSADAPALSDYLADAVHLAATMRTLPSGDGGRRFKRALMNAVDDVALEAGRTLTPDFAELRRRVMTGEV